MYIFIKIRHDILINTRSWVLYDDEKIQLYAWDWHFEKFLTKKWVSWRVLFKGLGVQKDTQAPCWLRPWVVALYLTQPENQANSSYRSPPPLDSWPYGSGAGVMTSLLWSCGVVERCFFKLDYWHDWTDVSMLGLQTAWCCCVKQLSIKIARLHTCLCQMHMSVVPVHVVLHHVSSPVKFEGWDKTGVSGNISQ